MLIPIGHEHSELDRWPLVSMVIFGLCLAAFFATHVWQGGSAGEAIMAVDEYVRHHPYARPRADFIEALLDEAAAEAWMVEIESRKQIVSDPPTGAVLAEQQNEMNRLCARALRLVRDNYVLRYGFVPASPSWSKMFQSMFIHAGAMHLLGNLLIFYLAAPFVEDAYGRVLFAVLYLAGGVAATSSHWWMEPSSTIPLIGASGAIAAVMGAFLVRYHDTRIFFRAAPPFTLMFGTFEGRAYIMLPLWFGSQMLNAHSAPSGQGGVAYMAHVGGFGFGFMVALAVHSLRLEERVIKPRLKAAAGGRPVSLVQGIAASESGDMKRAYPLLRRAVTEVPEDSEAHLELYECAYSLKQLSVARRHIVRHVSLALKQRLDDTAWSSYVDAARRDPQQVWPSAALFALARSRVRERDLDAAVAVYERVASQSPAQEQSARAWLEIARINARRGNALAARKALRSARERTMADPALLVEIAELESSLS